MATGRRVGWTRIMRAGVDPSLFGPTGAQGQRVSGSPHRGADHGIRRETAMGYLDTLAGRANGSNAPRTATG